MAEENKNRAIVALLAALRQVSVAKDALLDTGRFRHEYRTKEALFDALRPILAEHETMPMISCSAEKVDRDIIAHVTVEFVHVSGDSHTIEWVGQSVAGNDGKGISKAITSAYRTLLDNLFMQGVSDEGGRVESVQPSADLPPAGNDPVLDLKRDIMNALTDDWGMSPRTAGMYMAGHRDKRGADLADVPTLRAILGKIDRVIADGDEAKADHFREVTT